MNRRIFVFCSKCGKQAEGDFCWNCGAKLYVPSQTDNAPMQQEHPRSTKANKPVVQEERRLASYIVFSPTKSYKTISGKFEIDEVHQMMRLVPYFGGEAQHFHYQDIIDAELVQNDSAVLKTSTTSMITRAALGSIISGGMSIVAGATAKQNQISYIDSLYLRIYVKNNSVPTIKVSFISAKTATNSLEANGAMSNIEAVLGHIKQAQQAKPKETAYASSIPSERATPSCSGKWHCPECDYINNGNTCINCGASKPENISYIKATVSGEQSRAKIPSADDYTVKNKDEWFCTNCDFKNSGANKTCKNCGKTRSEGNAIASDPPAKKLFGFFKK